MILVGLLSARGTGRGGTRRVWRSSYAIIFLALVHLALLYQVPSSQLGRMDSEAWAAITAGLIAGIAADDDADAVGLLLVMLGILQILLLAGLLNLRAV